MRRSRQAVGQRRSGSRELTSLMTKIDKEEYQKRLDRISAIFAEMIQHADELSTQRCPYKNRFNQCTAKFGCRNQQKTTQGELFLCVGDDKLDYRSAWETS